MFFEVLMHILAVIVSLTGVLIGGMVSMAIVVFCYSALVVNFFARRQRVGFTFYDTKVYDRPLYDTEILEPVSAEEAEAMRKAG